jgi:hypothetical protein
MTAREAGAGRAGLPDGPNSRIPAATATRAASEAESDSFVVVMTWHRPPLVLRRLSKPLVSAVFLEIRGDVG